MHDRACSRCCLAHLRAAKSVERFDPEMFAQREDCLFGQKRVAVVLQYVINFAHLLFLFRADQQLGRRNARQLIEQGLSIFQLGDSEFAGTEISVRKTKNARIRVDGADIICALRLKQIEVTYRASADDLSDIARNNFSRLRLTGLIADGYAPPGLDQFCDVDLRSMTGHTTHWHAVAFS